jgi:hypothetical protein
MSIGGLLASLGIALALMGSGFAAGYSWARRGRRPRDRWSTPYPLRAARPVIALEDDLGRRRVRVIE